MSLTKTDLQLSGYHANGGDLVANVMYQATKCRCYPALPRKADIIFEKVTEIYKAQFEKIGNSFYLRYFPTYDDLFNWLKEYILPIPEIQELNLSRAEYEAGITIDDPERGKYAFCGRGIPDPLESEDFIDLDAFIRNLAHDLMRENIDINYSTF